MPGASVSCHIFLLCGTVDHAILIVRRQFNLLELVRTTLDDVPFDVLGGILGECIIQHGCLRLLDSPPFLHFCFVPFHNGDNHARKSPLLCQTGRLDSFLEYENGKR